MLADAVPPKIVNFFFKAGCDKTLADSIQACQLDSLLDTLDKHFCPCRPFVAQFRDTHAFRLELPRNPCACKLRFDESGSCVFAIQKLTLPIASAVCLR